MNPAIKIPLSLLMILPISFSPSLHANEIRMMKFQEQFLYDKSETDTVPASVHFDHFIFSVPEGWKNGIQDGVMMMAPVDLAQNELLAYMFLPSVIESSFENVCQETLNYLAQDFKGTLMTEVTLSNGGPNNFIREISGRSFKGWEYYKGKGHIKVPKVNDPYSSDVYEINLFLVKIHTRIERLVLVSKDVHDGVKESTTARNPKYTEVVKSFCFNLEFDDWKDTPYVNGKVTRNGISSIWSGLNYYINSSSVIFASTLQNTFLIFFDNGQVYFNSKFPAKGLDELNTLIEAEWNPQLWGTYTLQNGSGNIKLPFANIPFSMNGNKLVVNYMKADHEYSKYPAGDHVLYNGTWCGSGEVYGSTACISFTVDGKFSDNGVVRALENSLNDYYVSTPQSGNGTYEIKNNSIIFRFNTGFIFKTAFTGMNYQPGNSSPTQISFGSSEVMFQKN